MTASAAQPIAGEIVATPPAAGGPQRLSLLPLTALVVGSMIGGGTFNLPGDMSAHASAGAIIIGWAITGLGMLMLAFVYQGLATRKPELSVNQRGPIAYAPLRASASMQSASNRAWGYAGQRLVGGNVSNAVMIFGALAYFFPLFGKGNNVASVVGASVGLWAVHALVLRGVRQAALVNLITTAARFVPLVAFIVIAIFAFNADKFTINFSAGRTPGGGLGDMGSTR